MNTREKHNFTVFGLGGCGNNVLNHLIGKGLTGPLFVAASSNARALNNCLAPQKILVGDSVVKGGGCGGNAVRGRAAVEENINDITKAIGQSDMVFLTGGLGRGTASGGLPVVAKALSELKKKPLIVAVVTKPFRFENFRLPLTERSLNELYKYCNSVITVDNSKLESLDQDLSYQENLEKANEVLFRAVSSVIDLVETPGEINVDFADLSSVLSHKGPAIISFGEATGEKRASDALNDALSNPMLAETSLTGAQAIICNITADSKILVREVMEVNNKIHKAIGPKVKLFFGLVIDDSLKQTGALRLSVLASGLGGGQKETQKDSPIKKKLDPPVKETAVKAAALKPETQPAPMPQLNMEVETLGQKPKLTLAGGKLSAQALKEATPLANPVVPPGPYSATARRVIRPSLEPNNKALGLGREPGLNARAYDSGMLGKPPYRRKKAD
ncbi:MAG: cell division FtsZ family protein [Deltaproteobacteria bacterium]|jgi:cell division protein FtsZ|nr:cell division FtsZ family protein [Deltaproteobacteria bacterium]